MDVLKFILRPLYIVLSVDAERSHLDPKALITGWVLFDGVISHSSCLESLTCHSLDLAGCDHISSIIGKVSQIDETPESELRSTTIEGVTHHLGGKSESTDFDLITESLNLAWLWLPRQFQPWSVP